jgi:hypothetical protein
VADVVLHDPRKLWIGVAVGGSVLVVLGVAAALTARSLMSGFTLGPL